MLTYKLWDTKEKSYLAGKVTGKPLEFMSMKDADEHRDEYLDAGNYPDEPYTVIEIQEFEDGKYTGLVTLSDLYPSK